MIQVKWCNNIFEINKFLSKDNIKYVDLKYYPTNGEDMDCYLLVYNKLQSDIIVTEVF